MTYIVLTFRGGKGPDLIPLTSKYQNHVLPGGQCLDPLLRKDQDPAVQDMVVKESKDQNHLPSGEGVGLNLLRGRGHGLTVQDMAVTARVSSNNNLPSHTGEAGTVYTAGNIIYSLKVYTCTSAMFYSCIL